MPSVTGNIIEESRTRASYCLYRLGHFVTRPVTRKTQQWRDFFENVDKIWWKGHKLAYETADKVSVGLDDALLSNSKNKRGLVFLGHRVVMLES